MTRTLKTAVIVAAMLGAGCQSQQQIVDSMQSDAVHVAQRRGAFEMNCPAATAQVISNEMIQSPIINPRFAPPQRAEYTVGVSGCGQRATYLVICPEGGTGCIAGGSRNVIRQ
jgi:outer membrane murein-binding lipoprotein Lpp